MTIQNTLKRREIRMIEQEIERIDHVVADIGEQHMDGDYMRAAYDSLQLIIDHCKKRQLEMEFNEE